MALSHCALSHSHTVTLSHSYTVTLVFFNCRDGGHAPYMLAEESCCLLLPSSLTYLDGSLVACGVGTAWEALKRANVSIAADSRHLHLPEQL